MIIIQILLLIGFAFAFMEFFAWFMHKYVMHGFLWVWHEDHHRPHTTWWEKNDLFTLFFASIAILLIYFGTMNGRLSLVALGVGVTFYGLGYFLFHDVMFHRRLKFFKLKANTNYLKRIIRAHSMHHQNSTKDKGVAFGFLYASKKYDVIT